MEETKAELVPAEVTLGPKLDLITVATGLTEEQLLTSPKIMAVTATIQTLADEAMKLKAIDEASRQAVNAKLLDVKKMSKRIDEEFKPISTVFDHAHALVLKAWKHAQGPLFPAERHLKDEILADDDRRQRIREKEEADRKAAADAAKRASDEALAKAAAAQTLGQEDTARAKFDEAVRLDEAAKITAAAAPAPAPAPRLSNAAIREYWKFRITNINLIPDPYILRSVNEPKIQKVVDVMKSKTVIPGIEVYCEKGVSAAAGGWGRRVR